MTISEKLQQVSDIKDQIRESVNQKGGQLSSSAPFSDYPAAIQNLSGGSIPEGLFEITVESDDIEKGTVSGGGAVSEGMMVTVKATPADAGYGLEGWYEIIDGEEVFQSAEREYRFEATQSRNLIAKFGDAFLLGANWFSLDVPGISNSASSWCGTYGGGLFLLVYGDTASNIFRILVSDDLFNWNVATASIPYRIAWDNVIYFDEHFFLYSSIAGRQAKLELIRSSEGIEANWMGYTERETYPNMVYGNDIFFSISSTGSVVISNNGWDWAAAPGLSGGGNYICALYAGNRFVVGTTGGYVVENDDPVNSQWITHSQIPHTSASSRPLKALCYGDGVFIAVVQGTYVLRSTDLENWEEVSFASGAFTVGSADSVIAIYANGVFLIQNGSNGVYSRSAGLVWHKISYSGYSDWATKNFVYGNGAFIAMRGTSTVIQYSRSRGPALP